jgi:rubredoxin
MATMRTSRRVASPLMVAVEIHCPDPECGRDDPIPVRNGSFMWDSLPERVTCPDCGQTFRVSRKVQV